jgi:TRAP-type C4-dicarboxylate transport system substrate-binding protein
VQATAAPASAEAAAPVHLQVLGTLSRLSLFRQLEQPFWLQRLPAASGGRLRADIVAADSAGIRPGEILSLVRAGALPFAVVPVSSGMAGEPELSAIDLPGLHPDIATLRRSAAALRPLWLAALRERHGAELLAVYTYPAQVLFCRRAWAGGLGGLKGLRIRTSSISQSDWVAGLGAVPVQLPFNETRAQLEAGSLDCAITGAMSGNTIGLQDLSSQLHTMPVNWGVSMFLANRQAWNALAPDMQALLRRELATLESEVWTAAERETADGLACNTGTPACRGGRRGTMRGVAATPADLQRSREVIENQVLPAWLRRCGPHCAPAWNRTLAPLLGVQAVAPLS